VPGRYVRLSDVLKRWRKTPEAAIPRAAERRPEPEFFFDGLEPWEPGAKLTACRAGDRALDLASGATYLGYDFGAYGMLTLRFLAFSGDAPEQRIVLDFENLRSFIAVPAGGTRLVGQCEGWDYWPGAPGRASCTVYAGDANLSFSCSGVRLRVEDL
jgi:hypothetical protein